MKSTLALLAIASVAAVSYADGLVVDFAKEKGKIRRLNGICNTARINNSMHAKSDQLPIFKDLEIPCSRYHDAALNNPGYALVDISRIFPLFHLDADDPRNYIFKPTDDYVLRTLATGSEVEFKLGESIEHSKNRYRVVAPTDMKKLADICIHIVRHYNAGWANGYKLNIRRWSVWEEPNLEQILYCPDGKNLETYCRMYEAIVRPIKAEFPETLVGGPEDTGDMNFRRAFVQYCRDRSVPLDFVMFDNYSRDPEALRERIFETRKMLDEVGFPKARVGVAEWHYGPTGWQDLNNNPAKAKATTADLQGIDSGVYSASVLARMQDSPADDLFFYVPSGKTWGFFDGSQLNPNGLAFKAFKMMAAKGEAARVDVPSFPERGRYLLASKHGGKGWVMLCNFKRSDDAVLELKGATPVSVLRLDDVCRLEEVRDDWRWDAAPGTLLLKAPLASTSAMWLVECNLD